MALTVESYIVNPGIGGKFVILLPHDNTDDGILLLSDFSRDFQHADIVRRWEERRRMTAHTAGYRIAGGGWWKRAGDALTLFGQSAAYGRFDPDWLRSRLRAGMVANESRVDIR